MRAKKKMGALRKVEARTEGATFRAAPISFRSHEGLSWERGTSRSLSTEGNDSTFAEIVWEFENGDFGKAPVGRAVRLLVCP